MTARLESYAALVRDDVTTLACSFPGSGGTSYTFLCTRALADTLAVDDSVIVESVKGSQAVRIREVHLEPMIDPEDGIEYRWAFQKVDRDALQTQLDLQAKITDKLRERRKLSQRQQALAALGITDTQHFLAQIKE